jgi:argininosuccinate lyase
MAGLPFRTAHEVVATAAESGADRAAVAGAVEAVTGDTLSDYADPEAVERALDPAESVAMRDSRGGPAPDRVRAAIDRADARHEEHAAAAIARRDELAAARGRLEAEVEQRV